MVFLLVCLLFVAFSIFTLRRAGHSYSYSTGIAIAIGLSIVAVISLAQNYTQSLIPEANDGIAISNQVAYWIIGEDRWTKELFRIKFENSTYLTLFLIAAYPVVLWMESKVVKKVHSRA